MVVLMYKLVWFYPTSVFPCRRTTFIVVFEPTLFEFNPFFYVYIYRIVTMIAKDGVAVFGGWLTNDNESAKIYAKRYT